MQMDNTGNKANIRGNIVCVKIPDETSVLVALNF